MFWVASYDKLLPDRPLTANAVSLLVVAIEPLDIVQVPLLEVVHPAAPPGLNKPVTLALGTLAPVLMSRTVTETVACQVFPNFLADPVRLLIATVCTWITPGPPDAIA